MTGPSDAIADFQQILWTDAELVRITVTYADVTLVLQEPTGQFRRVICEGHLGYQAIGFWDEMVISRATLEAKGEFLESCLRALNERLGSEREPSGNEVRNLHAPLQLTIEFLDGFQIHIATNGLRTEVVSEVS